ncbi:hypothetical protein G7Y89_g13889 [Cudoniella acicularis]|uniref:Aquaporin n=1 Tax=Cudoniella acicularis TaxID=354080 RepID=A0A8H4VXT3_9HELO|nr:hypothetical protein G7Y89_g13889 [Cudoniella acicularis]
MDLLERVPTMNINRHSTVLSKADPLKHAFRDIFGSLPEGARGHVVAVIGELIGTIFFIFFAFAGGEAGAASTNKKEGAGASTGTDSKSPQLLLYIAVSAGFSLVVFASTFFRISGALFNPVVSLGMALIGAITWARCALLSVAQIVGTIAAAYMVEALFDGGLHVATELGGGISPAQGVVIEMLLTSQLVFTIFMLAAEKHTGTYLAPIGIGLSLFIGELVGVFWTGGSLNPARSLAPCIVNRSFTSYHWIYWVGPIAGTVLAVLLYKLVKALEYEAVNGEHHDPALPRINRKASSVIPLASIHTPDTASITLVSAKVSDIYTFHSLTAGAFAALPKSLGKSNVEWALLKKIDWIGVLLSPSSLGLMSYVMAIAGKNRDTWTYASPIVPASLSAILGAMFFF